MNGQLSIFNIHPEGQKLRPCDYRFQRYIGQMVQLTNGHSGRITEIFPYYTHVRCGNQDMVGTPTTMWPIWEE